MSRRSRQRFFFAGKSPRSRRGIRQQATRNTFYGRKFSLELLEPRHLLSADPITSLLEGQSIGSWAGVSAETYTSPPPPPRQQDAGGGSALATAPFPLEQTFFLHSLPGATKTIYLDFDGFLTRDTQWNIEHDRPNILTLAYSIDSDYLTFSDAELMNIQNIWERVSEDFRPFQVNVTTQDPGIEALRRTDPNDQAWGVRMVIGGSENDWYDPDTPKNAGGVAHIGSFNSPIDDPAFAFAADFMIAEDVAEVISHEVGHTLGLVHDSQFRVYKDTAADPAELVEMFVQYYAGHGAGETKWAPIMGKGYGVSLTQWSKGEYFNATNDSAGANPLQDDLEVITNRGGNNDNGTGYRADDNGNDASSATPLTLSENDTVYFGEGIIERNTDVDYFSFTVEGLGEVITLDISPFHNGPNLDVLARLYDSSNEQIAISNPLDGIAAGGQTASFSDGGWSLTAASPQYSNILIDKATLLLPAGTYFLAVEGAGRPITSIDPAFHPGPYEAAGNPPDPELPPDASDWGYSNYGSLGYYSITGTRKKGLVVGVDFDVVGGASPLNWNVFTGGGPQTVLSNLKTERGSTTPYSLSIETTGTVIESFASANPIDTATLPEHALPLEEVSGYIAGGGDTWTFTWQNLEPWSYHDIYVFGHADVQAENNVMIVGNPNAAPISPFTQLISPDTLVVNDGPPGTDELSVFSYRVLSNELGEIEIIVNNELGFAAALAGMAIMPTRPIGPVQNGSISGQKFDDLNGSHTKNSGEPGLGGWTVYIDENNDEELNSTVTSTPARTVTLNAPTVPQGIPDNGTVKNDIISEELGPIAKLTVTLDISHTYNGDLDVYLLSPSGTRVKLFSDVGGFSQNFTNTTLDDDASGDIAFATAPFTGTFRPEQDITPGELALYPGTTTSLSAFIGEDALGLWQLEITDDGNEDIGVLNSWSITVTFPDFESIEYHEVFTITDENGNYTFADLPPGVYRIREHILPAQLADGWRQTRQPSSVLVTSGADVIGIDIGNRQNVVGEAGSIRGQKWNDLNGNGIKDDGEPGLPGWIIYMDSQDRGVLGVRDAASEPVVLEATNLPKTLKNTLPPAVSTVNYGEPGSVFEIEVTISLTHSYVGDLFATLRSPSGKEIVLFNGVGGQFNNFHELVLSDSATESITSIQEQSLFDQFYNPQLGYTGTWKPQEALSAFQNEDAFGIWTLTVQDAVAFDEGTLDSWSLTISVGEPFRITDDEGNYSFEGLSQGTYVIREEQQPGWTQVDPDVTSIPAAEWSDLQWTVSIAPDDVFDATDVNFGNKTALGGDYNGNGVIDAADYVLWRKFNGSNNSLPNDGGLPTPIGNQHLTLWKSNFGATSGSGSGGGSADDGGDAAGGAGAAATSTSAEQQAETYAINAEATPQAVVQAEAADQTSATQKAVPARFATPLNSEVRHSHRAGLLKSGGASSTRASDAALVAWLASRTENDDLDDDVSPADAVSSPLGDDDSLDPIDSVFAVLGAA